MKIACADFSFPLLEHNHVLDLIGFLGVEGVDLALMGNRSHIRPEVVRDDSSSWAETLRLELQSRGLELADFFVIPWTDFERMAPNHPDATERDDSRALFRDMVQLTSGIGGSGLTILPGIHWPSESWEDSFDRTVEELQWRADHARENGLRFSVEAYLGSVIQIAETALRLVRSVDGLELTLDYTHFIVQGILESEIEVLVPHARHFHARGATPSSLQTSLRENTIDYDRVIDLLIETDYDGYVGIEYVWTPEDPPGGAYDLTKNDNVSETILLRDKIRARLAVHGRS